MNMMILDDPKNVDVSTLHTPTMCDEVMLRLDTDIGAIEQQLNEAADYRRDHGEFANPGWFRSAQRALKIAKTKRQEVQTRRGTLSRQESVKHQSRIETCFMDAARTVLTPQQFELLLQMARMRAASLEAVGA